MRKYCPEIFIVCLVFMLCLHFSFGYAKETKNVALKSLSEFNHSTTIRPEKRFEIAKQLRRDKTNFQLYSKTKYSLESADDNLTLVGRWPDGPCYTAAAKGYIVCIGNGGAFDVIDYSTPSEPNRIGRVVLPGVVEEIKISGNYAYVANGEAGLRIINLVNPNNPQEVGYFDTAGNSVAVTIEGNNAFIADETNGLQIVDISNPSSPTLVSSFDASDSWGVYDCAISGNYLFTAEGRSGMRILNISNIYSPQEITSFFSDDYFYDEISFVAIELAGNYAYIADEVNGIFVLEISSFDYIYPAGYFDCVYGANDLKIIDNYAYIAAGWEGLIILDVSTPDYPIEIASSSISGWGQSISMQNNYLFFAGEYGGLEIYDVSSINNPTRLGQYPTFDWTFGIDVQGNYAYTTVWWNGLYIFDITNPSSPSIVGFLEMLPVYKIKVDGSYAYIADGDGIINIVDISNAANPVLVSEISTYGGAENIFKTGTILYVADGDSGLTILNVADPHNPSIISHLDSPEFTIDLTVAGNYAYTAERNGSMRIIDISTPSSPKETATFNIDAYVNDIDVKDNVALLAAGSSGIVAVDISSSTNPSQIGILETDNFAYRIKISGDYAYLGNENAGVIVYDISNHNTINQIGVYNTGNYPREIVVENDRIFVADGEDGFYILKSSNESTDNRAPTLVHVSRNFASLAQDFTIEATASDDVGVNSATLYYRKGGQKIFSTVSMTSSDRLRFEGTIPASAITENGLEYYISVSDAAGNSRTSPLLNPSSYPHVVQVTYSSLNCPNTTAVNSYRMISVPGILQDKIPSSILDDDLGSYDNTQWRLYRGQGGTLVEYTVGNLNDFEPGNGYWLITKNSKHWDVGAGTSIKTGEAYSVTLRPGWNQIGNPFAFTIDWNNVTFDGDVEAPVAYVGNGNDQSGYRSNQTQIVPWIGYAIKNNESGNVAIRIEPIESTNAIKKDNFLSQWIKKDQDWILAINAECENAVDFDNYIGCLENAKNEWDLNDYSEPPPIGDYISLHFQHEDWNKYPGSYSGDFRSPNQQGVVWDFCVSSNIIHKVRLSLGETYNVPKNFEIVLLDKEAQVKVSFKDIKDYFYFSNSNENSRAFQLLVGCQEFINNKTVNVEQKPECFALSQNFPNPFNHSTFLTFYVAENSRVIINIFDIKGRIIRSLINQNKHPGQYRIEWDGTDDFGQIVSSGVYFVQMNSGSFSQTRKIILAK